MKVLHVTEDFSPENAGVTSAVLQMTRLGVADPQFSFEVVAVGSKSVKAPDNVPVFLCPCEGLSARWRYSSGLEKVLIERIAMCDVVQIHGIWMYPQWLALRLAARVGKPVILTPHNMLGGWVWSNGGIVRRLKKELYWNFLIKPLLKNLKVIHVLSDIEAENVRHFFKHGLFFIAPNGLDVQEVVVQSRVHLPEEKIPEKFYAFLGRIHPIKGLDIIIEAMGKMNKEQLLPFLIIGPEEDALYVKALKARVSELSLDSIIQFVGPVFGGRKYALLKNAHAVLAPSFSEGISMAALEAMACMTPVITTRAAGISDIELGGGGFVDSTPASMQGALENAFTWTEDERRQRGENALSFVKERYDLLPVGMRYRKMYSVAVQED